MWLLASMMALLSWTPATASFEIRGEVVETDGFPIAGARVLLLTVGSSTCTNTEGRFQISVPELPALVRVSHPRFGDRVVEVLSHQPLRVTLRPDAQPVDEVVVTARVAPEQFAPAGAAVSRLEPSVGTGVGERASDYLATVPGLALSGQGGQFQVFSIRGMSGSRVLTALEGIRLTTERRAGVSASFIDPFLLGELNVLRGASSSYHGSGAMGGTVDLRLRRFTGGSVATGWESQGHESYLASGWGDDRWSFAMSLRRADDASNPQGDPINSRFRQFSGALTREWSNAERQIRLLILPAYASDIGKPNTDYPLRVTEYPLERHLLVKFGIWDQSNLSVETFFHPQDLNTRTRDAQIEAEVRNRSFDFGLRSTKEVVLGTRASVRVGIDYFGRRGVTAEESQQELETLESVTFQTLEGALEDELGAQVSANVLTGRTVLEAGGRLLMLRQANGSSDATVNRFSGTGFTNVLVPIGDRLRFSAALGSGIRFPTLGERFFSGTTGRGEIVANARLEPERSIDLESGIRWDESRFFAAGNVFQKWIEDYIERIEPTPDVYTYTNLTSGTVRGVEWETGWVLEGNLRLFARGHWLRGRDSKGMPLADIPVRRLAAGIGYASARWRSGLELEFLGDKSDPGDGEKAIAEAYPMRGFIGFNLTPALEITAALTNIANERYFATADRKAVLEPGRSVRIGLNWNRE